MSWASKETEVAAQVVSWLTSQHWDVYQEVGGPEGTADIVARFNGRIWVVEVKQSLNLQVIEQAYRWHPYAHMVSVAYPSESKTRGKPHMVFGRQVCEKFGVGVLEVFEPTAWTQRVVQQTISPQLRRKPLRGLEAQLHERHKTYCAAGTAAGKRWTPFKETAEAVKAFVWANPGVDAKTLVYKIKHHYRSPVTAVVQIVTLSEQGVIPGVEVRRDGKLIRFFPKVAGITAKPKSVAEALSRVVTR